MDSKIPKGGIHKMNDAELQAAISRAEARERATRNLLSELRLHQLMRKNVKREHIKDNIARLQDQLAETE